MPDITFKTKDEIPESLREFAKETDGGFKVGVVHESFRDKNIALAKERDTLKTTVEAFADLGDDPKKLVAELTDLRDIAQKVKDGTLKKTDEIQAEAERRADAKVKGVKDELEAQKKLTAAAEAKAATYEGNYKALTVKQAISQAVLGDSGANPEALPDILSRANSVWRVSEEGKLVAKDGDTTIYGSDGEPITPKEWLGKLIKDAPYLGKQSSGGGASHGDGKGVQGTGIAPDAWAKMSATDRLNAARKAGVAN